jgi:hypothetical protein
MFLTHLNFGTIAKDLFFMLFTIAASLKITVTTIKIHFTVYMTKRFVKW